MSVSDADVAAEYRKRNEKVKLDVVPVTAEAFKSQVTVTDAELAPYFEKAKDKYRIGEKRKIKYAHAQRRQRCAQTITVPEAEIDAFYQQNITQYQSPAQVRASHILFKLEGKDEKAVQAKAEEVLKKAKAPAPTSRRWPSSTPRTTPTTERRRPRLLRPRPHGGRVRTGGVRDEGRRDQQPGEDRIRLPHHQGRRQQARGDAAAGRGAGRDSRIS